MFSPDETPDLHDLVGSEFQERYEQYEADAAAGKIKLHRTISAVDLWRKMLTPGFRNGTSLDHIQRPFQHSLHPQDHCGVVHSSKSLHRDPLEHFS